MDVIEKALLLTSDGLGATLLLHFSCVTVEECSECPGTHFPICKVGNGILVGVRSEFNWGLAPQTWSACSPSDGHPGNYGLLHLSGLQGGRMTLVFGCRHPDEDHLYREEMLEMAQKGVLHEVHTAYSRLPGQPKVDTADTAP